MKEIIICLAFMFLSLNLNAQSFIDQQTEQIARQALAEGTASYSADIEYASIVVIETKTGKLLANVATKYEDTEPVDWQEGNNDAVPSGLTRAAIYLALTGYVKPELEIDTGNGTYTDSISRCSIRDLSEKWGGYGLLTLDECLDKSNVGMIKASEIAFHKNAKRFSRALYETGILFGSEPYDDNGMDEEENAWRPCEIMGYNPYSLLQQAAWVNMVANGGRMVLRETENDDKRPIFTIRNREGLKCLRMAMEKIVKQGTGQHMQCDSVRVAGLTNATVTTIPNTYYCFATAFFPAESPRYTVAAYVTKRNLPAGRMLASKIVGQVINGMVGNGFLKKSTSDKTPRRIHPAEK